MDSHGHQQFSRWPLNMGSSSTTPPGAVTAPAAATTHNQHYALSAYNPVLYVRLTMCVSVAFSVFRIRDQWLVVDGPCTSFGVCDGTIRLLGGAGAMPVRTAVTSPCCDWSKEGPISSTPLSAEGCRLVVTDKRHRWGVNKRKESNKQARKTITSRHTMGTQSKLFQVPNTQRHYAVYVSFSVAASGVFRGGPCASAPPFWPDHRDFFKDELSRLRTAKVAQVTRSVFSV